MIRESSSDAVVVRSMGCGGKRVMIGDYVWAWKELVTTCLRVLPRHLRGETEENHEHLTRGRRWCGQGSNWFLPNISVQWHYCFILLGSVYPLFSLRSSSSCLRLLPLLSVTSIIPYIFRSIACFRRQFLHKTWPIQLAFLLFIVRRTFLSARLFVTLHFSHDQPNYFSPTFSSTFQNLKDISDLLSEMSNFLYHTKL
jgi:hypothetical protein